MNQLPDTTSLTIYKALRPDTQEELSRVVTREASSLALAFYNHFLNNEESAPFLSHARVHERLNASLELWIKNLFDPNNTDIEEETQKEIGKIHAHLGIPIYLVLSGAILIKNELGLHLIQALHDPDQLSDAILYACNRIDKAMAFMSSAYVTDTKKNVQEAEAYRAMSFSHDLTSEREGQHVALMEWSQAFLFALITHENILPSLSNSALGLWLRHRASILFKGTPELEALTQKIAEFDQEFLSKAQLINAETQQAFTVRFQKTVDSLKFLLSNLFKSNEGVTQGIDPLTTFLNRRFLSAILSREISTAIQAHMPLSVIIVEIDNFKLLSKQYDSQSSDAIIKKAAQYLQQITRPSDFIFRYTESEFLLVLVEMDKTEAVNLAQQIKTKIAHQSLQLPDLTNIWVSASVGTASYDGHPDHNFMIKSALEALKSKSIA